MLLALTTQAQSPKSGRGGNKFNCPVLVETGPAGGGFHRLGFALPETDGKGVNVVEGIHADFINMVDVAQGGFSGKCFVYLPISKSEGEMVIVDRERVRMLDLTYEQALKLCIP